jgi:hypothetical protein
VEALLIVSLPEGRVDTYKYKENPSAEYLAYMPYLYALPIRLACTPYLYAFSWSCLAESPSAGLQPAEVYEPANRNRKRGLLVTETTEYD